MNKHYRLDKKHYTEAGEPRRCRKCNSTSLKETTMGITANVVMEIDISCHVCGTPVGYWAHGYFDPCFAYRPAWYYWPVVWWRAAWRQFRKQCWPYKVKTWSFGERK